MKLFALTLAAIVLLAGCTSGGGKGDDDATGTSTSTATGGGTGSSTRTSSGGTGTGSSGPGTIAVDLTRSTPDGTVPLQVNLTLDADFKKGSSAATPSGVAWTLKVFHGNLTQANDTLARSGTSLPANLTLNLTVVGNHTLVAEVTAPGYATANDTVLVVASAGGPGAPVFFDGAETDGSQWTFSNELVIDLILERHPTGEEHPEGGWEASDAEARTGTKSWHAPYPDHYEGRMTSVAFPSAGRTLSYWYKGGSEGNDVDGLYVLAGPDAATLTEVAYHGGPAVDWTQNVVGLPAGSKVVQLLMFGDASCSSDPAPVGGGDGTACGPGWDAGGFFVDDLTVT